MLVGTPATGVRYCRWMDTVFIHGRVALTDAAELIEAYGEQAALEAAVRARRSRNDGNVSRFCHWRQIERVIEALSSEEATGTIH
jgi:head-tail adaptor